MNYTPIVIGVPKPTHTKKKKGKIMTKTKAKAKAWKAFSLFIRQSHADSNGFVTCYTCPSRMYWNESDAGHGIPGRNNAVLFMSEVVRPQCKGCNVFGRGRLAVFTLNLIKELGIKKYEKLVEQSNQTVQYKTSDYQTIEELYKGKLKNI